MKLNFFRRVGQPWCVGLVLLVLRLVQNLTGFDPDTGLSLPSLPGVILVALLAADALYEILRSFRMDKTRARLLPAICPAGKRGSFPGGRMLSSDCRRRVDCYLRRRRNCRCSRHRNGGDGGCLRRRGLIPGPAMRAGGTVSVTPCCRPCSLAYSWCWRSISRRLTTRCWPGTICRCWPPPW